MDDKMKILIITPTFAPAWKFGGTVTAMLQMAKALNSINGVSVTIFTTNASGEKEKLKVPSSILTDFENINTYYFDSYIWNKSAYYSYDLIANLRKRILEFDLVYISAIWQFLGYKSAMICKEKKVPYIVGVHGSFSEELRKKSFIKKNIYYLFFLKRMLSYSKAIHVTGQQEITNAGKWLEGNNLIRIPNIIDSSKYYISQRITYNLRKKLNIPNDAKVILTVSRPDWKKRVDLILQAIKDISNIYFVYVGDENNILVDQWKKLSKKLNIEDRFKCTGKLTGNDLLSAYATSDLFVLASVNENFGMVVIEAMLCGLPVVITEEVGVGEYLEDNKYIKISKLSCESLKKNIQDIIRNDFIKECVRDSVKDLFSPNIVATNIVKEFQKIVKGKL